jgi:predicted HD phosphohydrolase
MDAAEVKQFQTRPHFEDALRLRRWDDAAKVVDMKTPDLEHFVSYLDAAAGGNV